MFKIWMYWEENPWNQVDLHWKAGHSFSTTPADTISNHIIFKNEWTLTTPVNHVLQQQRTELKPYILICNAKLIPTYLLIGYILADTSSTFSHGPKIKVMLDSHYHDVKKKQKKTFVLVGKQCYLFNDL